jgi:hypothetical protein
VSCLNEKLNNVRIVTGEEIQRIDILDQPENSTSITKQLDVLFEDTATTVTDIQNLDKRMHDMVDWMKKNHLPVKLETDENSKFKINILDSVFIKPPFTIESCESTNEIVLDKVRQLINNFSSN